MTIKMMKNTILTIAIICIGLVSNSAYAASAPDGDDLVWFEFIDKAYAESEATGKPILANFTGSDWCGWCIRLHKEVFGTEEFKLWAKKNVVLLELDYPRRTKLPEALAQQNAQLQQVFKISGYPTIWIFNLNMDEATKKFDIAPLGKTGYVAGGPKPWIEGANQILSNNPNKPKETDKETDRESNKGKEPKNERPRDPKEDKVVDAVDASSDKAESKKAIRLKKRAEKKAKRKARKAKKKEA